MGDRKVWEEAWTLEPDPSGGVVVADDATALEATGPEQSDRARLASAAPDLVRALLAVEVDINYDEATCASCQAPAAYDHATSVYSIPKHEPDCALDAALRKAGVR